MEINPSAINTVLLVLLLPLVGAFWRTFVNQSKEVADAIAGLGKTINHLETALTGYEGQGGALMELRGLRERVHLLESMYSALAVHTNLPTEAMPKRRREDR